MSDYIPDFSDVIWVQRAIEALEDGGIIAYPKSALIYRVDKTRKVWTLLNPAMLRVDRVSRELHARTKNVLAQINWTVEETGNVS